MKKLKWAARRIELLLELIWTIPEVMMIVLVTYFAALLTVADILCLSRFFYFCRDFFSDFLAMKNLTFGSIWTQCLPIYHYLLASTIWNTPTIPTAAAGSSCCSCNHDNTPSSQQGVTSGLKAHIQRFVRSKWQDGPKLTSGRVPARFGIHWPFFSHQLCAGSLSDTQHFLLLKVKQANFIQKW